MSLTCLTTLAKLGDHQNRSPERLHSWTHVISVHTASLAGKTPPSFLSLLLYSLTFGAHLTCHILPKALASSRSVSSPSLSCRRNNHLLGVVVLIVSFPRMTHRTTQMLMQDWGDAITSSSLFWPQQQAVSSALHLVHVCWLELHWIRVV